jgi:hypothetical protein
LSYSFVYTSPILRAWRAALNMSDLDLDNLLDDAMDDIDL